MSSTSSSWGQSTSFLRPRPVGEGGRGREQGEEGKDPKRQKQRGENRKDNRQRTDKKTQKERDGESRQRDGECGKMRKWEWKKKTESSEQPVKNKNRRSEKEHKEKTITLHSVFTNISMSWHASWTSQYIQCVTKTRTHTHKGKTKCQMSARRCSFSLFVCCCFFLCTETRTFLLLLLFLTIINVKYETRWKKQHGFCKKHTKKTKVTTTEWLTKTTTLVHSIVCVWVRIKNPDSKHELLAGIWSARGGEWWCNTKVRRSGGVGGAVAEWQHSAEYDSLVEISQRYIILVGAREDAHTAGWGYQKWRLVA